MEYYLGKIETLTDCERAGRNLMGECDKRLGGCGHMRGFSPFTLRCDLKRDMALIEVAKLMRCRFCNQRGTVQLAYRRNVVEAHMERLRAYPEFRVMIGEFPPSALKR